MTKKYFYTDALKAAWMTREFGIKIDGSDVVSIYKDTPIDEYPYEVLCSNAAIKTIPEIKYYIHPDCHEMLKPQVGDVLQNKGIIYKDIKYDVVTNLNAQWIQVKPIIIIQRNGNAFFMPECEE